MLKQEKLAFGVDIPEDERVAIAKIQKAMVGEQDAAVGAQAAMPGQEVLRR